MDFNEDRHSVIDRFERMVMTPPAIRRQVAQKLEDSLPVQRKNPIYQKGQRSQQKRKLAPIPVPMGATQSSSIREQALHDLIVEHPYLLHTPELYAGGLYLEALINKYRLPCQLITDFTYITVQDRVIKITLVEIEKASKGVFHRDPGLLSTFRSETMKAIDQVRGWRESLRHDSSRHALMLYLKPLFPNYPVAIFDPSGDVSKMARIEISYVLVVGNERPSEPEHQKIVDDLYLNEDIIFMTYPQMIEQIRLHHHDKNVIKLGPHGIRPCTVRVPDALAPIASQINLPVTGEPDPWGVKLGGLGWRLETSSDSKMAMHPASIKAIFYRSRGICEKPDCNHQVVTDGMVSGCLSPIYNVIDNDSDVPTFWHTKFVALACPMHLYNINARDQLILGKFHPLNKTLEVRWPYDAQLDQQALTYTRHWQANWMNEVADILELDAEKDFAMIADLKQWCRAVMSLTKASQGLLADIIEDHFLEPRKWRPPVRNGDLVNTHLGYHSLLRSRVIRVNHAATPGLEIEPTVFSQQLIDYVKKLYGGRAMMAIKDLCTGSLRGLSISLRSQRRQEADEEAMRKAIEDSQRPDW